MVLAQQIPQPSYKEIMLFTILTRLGYIQNSLAQEPTKHPLTPHPQT